MTREETLQVLAILKAAYPSSYSGMTKREANGTVSVWSMQFADVPVEIVLMAVQKLISTSKFPPAISEVRNKISKLHWEAQEFLYSALGPTGTHEEIKRIQWVYDMTREFKYTDMAEPSLGRMLAGGQMLQIGSGD